MQPRAISCTLILFVILAASPSNTAAQACGAGPNPSDLCYGIGDPVCTTSILTNCSAFPRCTVGHIGFYYGPICANNCVNTMQEGSCGAGRICMCVKTHICQLCSWDSYQNLSVCNDNADCGISDSVPPNVTITFPTSSPTYTTTVSPMSMAGTASDNTLVSQVNWSNDRNSAFVGGSGLASGTTSWSASYINLESGLNVITATAKDAYGNVASDTISVTYNPPSNQSFPIINLIENSTDYYVSISDPDALTEVSYAWGARPNIYFLLPFANDSTPVLSAAEKARYSYIIANTPSLWDGLTFNKHPLNFFFVEPFVVRNYMSSQNDWFTYVSDVVAQLKTDYASIHAYPAIYVILYPEPYFGSTYTNIFGQEGEKTSLAEVYISMFNDQTTASDETVMYVILHELTHDFAVLPNDVNFPPGNTNYFWKSHPAAFYGPGMSCDENTSLLDCIPYGAYKSPTGTEGYFEVNSILSPRRLDYPHMLQIAGVSMELTPLVEMAMGIRSKYEDANFMYYEGFYNATGFTLLTVYDFSISDRRLHDYNSVERKPGIHWDIRFDSPKTVLANSTRSIYLPKSAQLNKSLLVFASDYQNPGYFKAFGNNAFSSSFISDSGLPSVPSSLTAVAASSTRINLSWSAASDNIGVAYYRIYRNGTFWAETPTTTYQDSGLSPSTTYAYRVAAYDAAGNTGGQSAQTLATTLAGSDVTLPSIQFVPPTPANNTSVAVNYIFANASLSEAPSSCMLGWFSTSWQNFTMTLAGLSCYRNMTGLANGTYRFRVYASDLVGNANVSEMRQNTIASSSACVHESDTDCDGCVEMPELNAYIVRWKIDSMNDVTMVKMMAAIALWKKGC